MVVVIISAAAMPAPLIELADLLGDLTTIVLRIEDWDAINAKRDGSTKEAVLDRGWFLRHHRMQGNAPRVVPKVGMRQRHLLLPRRDADHHIM